MKSTHLHFPNRLAPLTRIVILLLLGLALAGYVTGSAQTPQDADQWKSWQMLLGQWESAPDTSGAVGGSTFSLELQKRVIVRKNFAKYPKTKDRGAINHEDMLVIFQQPGNPVEASYWDNEGHYIHYLARISDNQDTASFASDVSANSPRFRLSYIRLGIDSLRVGFEVAPPGQADAFHPYLSGTLIRKR
jgi:hypothetical protein